MIRAWNDDQPYDRFLREQLEADDVAPSLPASVEIFIGRVTLDLMGLPPAYEEIEDFVKDNYDFQEMLDPLLKSPRYGERWGRQWLNGFLWKKSASHRKSHMGEVVAGVRRGW